MKKWKYLLLGVAFFILAAIAISMFEPSPPLLSSTQVSGTKHPFLYEGIVSRMLAVQEVTLIKDYLNGIEIRFATMGRVNTNTNTIIVLDSNYNLLHQENFSSKIIGDAKYHTFQFKESRKIGKGNKIYICLFSRDGDNANCIHGLFNSDVKLGSLYSSVIYNDDVIGSIKNKARLYPGSMVLRTYESDSSLTSAVKRIWYFAAALLALLIIFLKRFQTFLAGLNIRAEIVYLSVALIFGPLYVFLNPPFQVPDEGSHIIRTYELSEFQFSKTGKTVPASIYRLDSTFVRLHFDPDEKTSKQEILSFTKVELKPNVRRESNGPDYIVPYLPQLTGLIIGKLFNSTPLILLYFERFFNLVLNVLIVFLAIRITPVAKWAFFLLALMPKTVFLMASVSYDAFLISCSFLLIALFLYYSFKAGKLKWRDIGLLFFLSMLLALCKPPYFIIGFMFLIIPFRKIGSLTKYLLIFSVFVVSMLLAQGMWSFIGGLIKSADAIKTEQLAMQQPAKAVPDAALKKTTPGATGNKTPSSNAGGNKTPAPDPAGSKQAGNAKTLNKEAPANQQTAAPSAPAPPPSKPEINPAKQINYLRTHIPAFINLLITTNFIQMRTDMLNNFVGTMGWLDTLLPNTYVNIYLILLLVTALCIADSDNSVDWKRKGFFFILFFTALLTIETAMYIFSSYVAQDKLYGIQGRYFIPLAPLFLLIFYNNAIAEKLNYIFSPKRTTYLKAKPKLKPDIILTIRREQIFTKFLQLFIVVFTVVTLARGLAAIMLRYYQW